MPQADNQNTTPNPEERILRKQAEQLLNAFLVHRELVRVYTPGSISEVPPEQMRLWSETYAAQRIHLVDLIVAGLRSGTVLF